MAVSDRFKALVDIYRRKTISAPNLKVLTIAQWIHESGRGTSELCMKHNNFGGLKYRIELNRLCKPVEYVASDGVDIYCSFDSMEKFLQGYWTFISRSPYQGWGQFKDDPEGYLRFIFGCKYAMDPDYVNKVLGHYDEAEELFNEPIVYDNSAVSWIARFHNEGGTPTLVAYAGADPVCKFTSKIKEEQHSFENLFNNARTVLSASPKMGIPDVADWSENIPQKPTPKPPTTRFLTGKKMLLDPGHSELRSGARGIAPDYPDEHSLNKYLADRLAAMLREQGAEVKIIDPVSDELSAIGSQAAGFDMFISCHHNAFNNKDHYTCVMIHRNLYKKGSLRFAKISATNIAKALNHKLIELSADLPRGVYPNGLSVLSAAERTDCPVCVLVEPYFIDAYGDKQFCYERTAKAASAIAQSVVEYYQ